MVTTEQETTVSQTNGYGPPVHHPAPDLTSPKEVAAGEFLFTL